MKPLKRALLNPCLLVNFLSPGAPVADADSPEVVAFRRGGVAHGVEHGGGGPKRLGETEGGYIAGVRSVDPKITEKWVS